MTNLIRVALLLFAALATPAWAAQEVIRTISAEGNLTGGGSADYTSLADWQAGEARNLVTADEIAVLEVDWVDGAIVTNDNFQFSGWTLDSDHPIIIRPRAGSEHNGVYSGAAHFQATASNNRFFDIRVSHVRIDGLVLHKSGTSGSYCIITASNPSNVKIRGNICAVSTGANGFQIGANSGVGNELINNLLIDLGGTGGTGIHINAAASHTLVANNTVIGFETGIDNNSEEHLLKNNLVQDSGTADYAGNDNVDSASNISSDATSPDGATFQNISLTFADAENDDYHLAAGDTDAIGAGEDLSAFFTTDIDGETRVSWDIGADEFSGEDETPPTVESAAVDATGLALTVVFSEPVTVGTDGWTGFALGGVVGETLTYSAGDGTDTVTWVISDATVMQSDTVTLDFTQPGDGVQDAAGNLLASFSDEPVTNNSTQVPPDVALVLDYQPLRDTDSGELIDIESAEIIVLCGDAGARTLTLQDDDFAVVDGVVEIEDESFGVEELTDTCWVGLIESATRAGLFPATVINRND